MSAAVETAPHAVTVLMDEVRTRIDLRAEPEFRERIEAQAKRYGLTLSAYIRIAVTERLERDEADAPATKPRKKKAE